ncbi:MAG: foldase protein PrsA [Methylococcaceae bacterium]
MNRYVTGMLVIAGNMVLNECNAMSSQTTSGNPHDAVSIRPDVKPGDILAMVNGKPIARSALGQNPHRNNMKPEDSQRDELVERELLRQEAERDNLLKDPAVAEKLDNAIRLAMSQISAEHYIKSVSITDNDVRKEYEGHAQMMKKTEYKARHILVDSEKKAVEIIEKLNKGNSFEELARKHSSDKASQEQGGDLGWFTADAMVEPFSVHVMALKNGEIGSKPIQTQFGWHIVQRLESREQKPPAFEQVQNQIRAMLQTRQFHQHLDDLKQHAKIEITEPNANNTSPGTQQP